MRRDRNDTRDGIGGGLLVYSRKEIKVVPEPQFDTNNFNQFCAFKVITKGRPLQIILAYRPPSSGTENTEKLCKLMQDWNGDGILIGDINMPGINWREKRSVPLYSFLYSGKCSFHNQTVFTNNSCIPSYRKFFHEKPSERYHQARVFMLSWTGTNEL